MKLWARKQDIQIQKHPPLMFFEALISAFIICSICFFDAWTLKYFLSQKCCESIELKFA